mmetsp:Transcript_1395/g.4776  ORF Transcript_1395/g.4776 Transcript_1395/m.4776 type:complete len:225 (-) Transcript_1395:101-775(-)
MMWRKREEAAAYLEEKIEADAMASGPHHRLAALLGGDEALRHLQMAVVANPRNVDARNDLALAIFRRGHWQRALAEFERCLAIDPEHALSHKNVAAVYAARGRYDDAIRHAQRATKLAPRDAQAHRNLARLYDYARGDSRLAVEHTELAIQHGPGRRGVTGDVHDADAYRRLAIQRVGRGETASGFAHDHYDHYRALTGRSYVLPNSHTTVDLLLKARQSNLPL